MSADVVEQIAIERERRLQARAHGRAYHHWKVRGDTEPPPSEHWCDYCAGWFGVPHDLAHDPDPFVLCRSSFRSHRVCACIDCAVIFAARRTPEGTEG